MKSILKQDKEKISPAFLNMIKSDVFNMTSSYLDFNNNDLAITYFIDSNGFYNFQINIKAGRIKRVNFYKL